MPERWGALPLGELHPVDRCALCGIEGKEHPIWEPVVGDVALKRTTLALTRSHALVCVDTSTCERRREQQKRLV